jgi:hypothetical protein
VTKTTESHLTHCGLPGIAWVPFGMHACHFYGNREELLAALVPFALAGLHGNERCLLVAAQPLPSQDLIAALRAAWDGVDDAMARGALKVLDFDQWYTNAAELKGSDVVKLWLDEEERALADGYSGIRISGNVTFLEADTDWSTFMEYEKAVTDHLVGRRIVALCSYALDQCSEQLVVAISHAHHCKLEHPDSNWAVGVSELPRGLSQSF